MKTEELNPSWDELWSEVTGLLPDRHLKTCVAVGHCQIPNHLGYTSPISAFEQQVEQEITATSPLSHSFECQHSMRKYSFREVLNPLLPGFQSRANHTIRSSLTAVSLLTSKARWQMQAVLGSVSTLCKQHCEQVWVCELKVIPQSFITSVPSTHPSNHSDLLLWPSFFPGLQWAAVGSRATHVLHCRRVSFPKLEGPWGLM